MQIPLMCGAYHNSRKPTTQHPFVKMEHGQGFQNVFQVSLHSKKLSISAKIFNKNIGWVMVHVKIHNWNRKHLFLIFDNL